MERKDATFSGAGNRFSTGLKRVRSWIQPCLIASFIALLGFSLIAQDSPTSSLVELVKNPRSVEPDHVTFDLHGWTIHLHDRFLDDDSGVTGRALELLNGQLKRVVEAVPAEPLKQLRAVPLWINPEYEGKRGGAEYHGNINWLRENGRNPKMVKAVEITNVKNFPFENRRMPYLLLHELTHAYHDQILKDGFQNPELKAAYERARGSGTYDSVARFNGNKIIKDKAYGMNNPMEYFAESTEAYFGKNDFFPFNREELEKHDPRMCALVGKLWKVESP
ncbi:MAG: hypothetical protein P1U86_10780 [Verrucomicrobiales bacterium]|nr:hypothetical protein [Verrucomicrobiales bacterium]